MVKAIVLLFAGITGLPAFATQSYQGTGLVLGIDASHRTVTISGKEIAGLMPAMVMSYAVRDPKLLAGLRSGSHVNFTLIVNEKASYLSAIGIRKFESSARDPVQVQTLDLLESVMNADGNSQTLKLGQPVPDFTLKNQNNQLVRFSDLRGKAVAISFAYTRCPLPDYCFRLSNNFGQIQKRFAPQMGKRLVLLTITFDPAHDTPEVLKKYAGIWNAKQGWHFLTGSLDDVKRVCGFFGMNFWPDEGLLTHSLHTVLVDRDGRLYANLEGNEFSANQLGDLVGTMLRSE